MSVIDSSDFPLFGLPLELLEYLTLFFKHAEALPLLVVSSSFHDLFSRSVWHTVARPTLLFDESNRIAAFARYGHLVRKVSVTQAYFKSNQLFDWVELFPNTTGLAFQLDRGTINSQKQLHLDAITKLHGLHSVKVYVNQNTHQFSLDAVAQAVILRSQDENIRRLRKLTVYFDGDSSREPWSLIVSFVKSLAHLEQLVLGVSLYVSEDVPRPSAEQLSVLRPHLIDIPHYLTSGNLNKCVATRNRQLCSPLGFKKEPLVFHQLDNLEISVCCASQSRFDYADFTPAKYPQLEELKITSFKCNNHANEEPSALETIVLKKWPYLRNLITRGSLSTPILDKLHTFHSQLNVLNIQISEQMVQEIKSLNIKSDWTIDDVELDCIRKSRLDHFGFYRSHFSPSALELLFIMPKLAVLDIGGCQVDDVDATTNMFKRMQQMETKPKELCMVLGVANEDSHSWPEDLILAMVGALKGLTYIQIHGDDYANKMNKLVRERFNLEPVTFRFDDD
ncbi:hypothetical protein GQ42DRAFT_176154 [Ramicandelaber brevisporus]|nr:hypothetical protein GQ42DRAFT_176154 [Ramicandelaber brevisporus]